MTSKEKLMWEKIKKFFADNGKKLVFTLMAFIISFWAVKYLLPFLLEQNLVALGVAALVAYLVWTKAQIAELLKLNK